MFPLQLTSPWIVRWALRELTTLPHCIRSLSHGSEGPKLCQESATQMSKPGEKGESMCGWCAPAFWHGSLCLAEQAPASAVSQSALLGWTWASAVSMHSLGGWLETHCTSTKYEGRAPCLKIAISW